MNVSSWLQMLQKYYDMHALELSNIELAYSGRVNKNVIRDKSTIIRRLQQQQTLRDKLIEQQRELLRGERKKERETVCVFMKG
jgi:hypothetical protein